MHPHRTLFTFHRITATISALVLAAPLAFTFPAFAQSSGTTTTSSNPNATVASSVQSYFADVPVMIAIAKCESGPRQFAADGSPLYAGTGGRMIGIFQLDSLLHTADAAALGYDISTVAGNIGFARYLYGSEGTAPWLSSFPCWSYAAGSAGTTATTPASDVPGSPILTLNLTMGMIDPQILTLQKILNQIGYTVSDTGPGSPGNETTKFGALTRVALRKFQCDKGITCSGNEASTGYGFLNAPTRAALLATAAKQNATSSSETQSSAVSSTPAISTFTASTDNPAEIAALKSRVAALVVIVQQLMMQLAARANGGA